MQPLIRAAEARDAAAMIQIRREAIESRGCSHYEQPVIDAWVAQLAATREAMYVAQINDPDDIVLIAEFKSESLGFAIARPRLNDLTSIYVRPNAIGRVGSALLSELESRAFRTTDTLTMVASLNAVDFYVAHGYDDEGPTYYRDRTGAEVPCRSMRKTVSNTLPTSER